MSAFAGAESDSMDVVEESAGASATKVSASSATEVSASSATKVSAGASEAIESPATTTSAYTSEETEHYKDVPGGALPAGVKTFLGHRQFNTTSTVMVANTIASPDLPQIFFT